MAVAVGFIVWTVLYLGSNALLSMTSPESFNESGATDSAGMLIFLILLSVVYSVVAGLITSRLAASKSLAAPLLLGVILLIVGIFVQIQYWELLPLWYHLSFLLLLIPGVYLGARLQTR